MPGDALSLGRDASISDYKARKHDWEIGKGIDIVVMARGDQAEEDTGLIGLRGSEETTVFAIADVPGERAEVGIPRRPIPASRSAEAVGTPSCP